MLSPEWSDDVPLSFKISAKAGQLAGALLFEQADGERLIIMLGSSTDGKIGFGVTAESANEGEELQRLFRPQSLGTPGICGSHVVDVNAELHLFSGREICSTDIVIATRKSALPHPNRITGTPNMEFSANSVFARYDCHTFL